MSTATHTQFANTPNKKGQGNGFCAHHYAKDGGEPVRRDHTVQQIIQVGTEGAAFVQAQLDRRAALGHGTLRTGCDRTGVSVILRSFPAPRLISRAVTDA